METTSLTPEEKGALAGLAEAANQELEDAGQRGANQAFNLGCSASLIPGVALVLVIFVLARANWIVTFGATILVLIGILVFANLAAYTAKTRTIDRTYELHVLPTIERTLKDLNLTRPVFDRVADEVLQRSATLRQYIVTPSGEEEAPNSGTDEPDKVMKKQIQEE